MPAEAQAVRQLFDEVAPHYDRLNDLLSLGLHRLWKREMVQRLAPVAGEQWLDLCCGTGDLASIRRELSASLQLSLSHLGQTRGKRMDDVHAFVRFSYLVVLGIFCFEQSFGVPRVLRGRYPDTRKHPGHF